MKKVTRGTSTLGPSATRCNAQIHRRPKGQGWSAQAGCVHQNTLKMRCFGENDPFTKNFEILFGKFS